MSIGAKFLFEAVTVIGGFSFVAFGCVFVLRAAQAVGEESDRFRERVATAKYEENQSMFKGLYPGCNVFNTDGARSTLGVFLVPGPDYPTSAYSLEYFTVSAHSFLRKRKLGFNVSWSAIVAVPIIARMVYSSISRRFFDLAMCQQYLIVRNCLWMWDIFIVSNLGRNIMFRNYVMSPESALMNQNGPIELVKNLTMLQMSMVYMFPIMARWLLDLLFDLSGYWGFLPTLTEIGLELYYLRFLVIFVAGADVYVKVKHLLEQTFIKKWGKLFGMDEMSEKSEIDLTIIGKYKISPMVESWLQQTARLVERNVVLTPLRS